MLWHVFSRLPPEVRVYPSENYYYWQLDIDGRHLQGNIRLSANARDEGMIGFAYSEQRVLGEDTAAPERLVHRAILGAADGVTLTKSGDRRYDLGYSDHFVRFHLENLPQTPPRSEILRQGEEFVARTFDESGLQFLLLFQARERFFFWVLDEAPSLKVAEHFVFIRERVVIGRRTRFVFRVDGAAGDRKVLIGVSRASVQSNDYYDGPFDQLPDNHVESARLHDRMIIEAPELKGKIDRFGFYIDDKPPMRVALVRYAIYSDRDHLERLLTAGERAANWLEHFASQPK